MPPFPWLNYVVNIPPCPSTIFTAVKTKLIYAYFQFRCLVSSSLIAATAQTKPKVLSRMRSLKGYGKQPESNVVSELSLKTRSKSRKKKPQRKAACYVKLYVKKVKRPAPSWPVYARENAAPPCGIIDVL